VTWSPDGSALAAASNYGGEFTIWDQAGKVINQIKRIGGGPTLGGSIAFLHGSSQLVFLPPGDADNSKAFAIWDVTTGKIVKTENGPQPDDDYPFNRADHFVTTPDQTLLATATRAGKAWKGFRRNVTVYDTGSWRVRQTVAVPPGISSLCVFARGRLIGVGSIIQERIAIIDAESGAVVNEVQAYAESKYGSASLGAIAGSPEGDLIMVGVGLVILNGGDYYGTTEQRAWGESIGSTEAVQVFRVSDGARIASFPAAKAPIRQAMWDPKGRFVAFVDNASHLFLWAPWFGDGYKKIDLPSSTSSLAVSPDGLRIAVTTDRGVRVFSVN
jgi:WD40 repeat protein